MIRLLDPSPPDGRLRYLATVACVDAVGLTAAAVPRGDGALPSLLGGTVDLTLLYVLYCAMSRRLRDAGRGPATAAATLALVIAGGLAARTGATTATAVLSLATCVLAVRILTLRPRDGAGAPRGHGLASLDSPGDGEEGDEGHGRERRDAAGAAG